MPERRFALVVGRPLRRGPADDQAHESFVQGQSDSDEVRGQGPAGDLDDEFLVVDRSHVGEIHTEQLPRLIDHFLQQHPVVADRRQPDGDVVERRQLPTALLALVELRAEPECGVGFAFDRGPVGRVGFLDQRAPEGIEFVDGCVVEQQFHPAAIGSTHWCLHPWSPGFDR